MTTAVQTTRVIERKPRHHSALLVHHIIESVSPLIHNNAMVLRRAWKDMALIAAPRITYVGDVKRLMATSPSAASSLRRDIASTQRFDGRIPGVTRRPSAPPG